MRGCSLLVAHLEYLFGVSAEGQFDWDHDPGSNEGEVSRRGWIAG